MKDLCIVPDKLSWVLYCDMVCLDYDGSVVDACLITLMSSLKTCMIIFIFSFVILVLNKTNEYLQ